MKKIILACDGKNFPNAAFDFANQLNQSEQLLLTGVFLHPVNFEDFLPNGFVSFNGPLVKFMEDEKVAYKKMIRHFEDICQRNGIEYRVHEESMNWNIDDISKETRFADMMIMSEELFCNDINLIEPNSFMLQTFRKAECAVLCIPEKQTVIDKIVFAYNGKKDCMFALKQFCFLLPELTSKEIKIVYINEDKNDSIPDFDYLEEYAARHFKTLDFEKLEFHENKNFTTWALNAGNILLVTGSFGRSGLSTIFKKSFLEDIITEHRIPVFVAHT